MSSRGLPGAQDAVQTPTTRPTSSAALRRGFSDRLDDAVTRAIEAFQSITASCTIRDRASNARADYQAEVESANLARAADELLRLISELKIAAVVQDVTDAKNESAEVRGLFNKILEDSFYEIRGLRDSVTATLATLEEHYYNSCARWGSSTNQT